MDNKAEDLVETSQGLLLSMREGYPELYAQSERINDVIEYAQANHIHNIIVSKYYGYKKQDISFLKQIAGWLEGLTLDDEPYGLDAINSLHRLKTLRYSDNKKDIVNLGNFPDLKTLSIDYTPRVHGLSLGTKVENLVISGYIAANGDFSDLPELPKLTGLSVIKSNISNVAGIDKQRNLKRLLVYRAPKLTSIHALKGLSSIEKLEIENCKAIADYASLGSVKSLKHLRITQSGQMDSLDFLELLKNLEVFSFWGTNVLDGDLSYLKKLEFVGFDNKRHYSHNIDDFKAKNAIWKQKQLSNQVL